jgi:hypothetical protein
MRAVILSLVPVLAIAACDNKETSGTSSSTTTTASTSSTTTTTTTSTTTSSSVAAIPLPKCPAGLTGNAVPAYCIKLPPSYKVKEARTAPTRGSVDYDTGSPTDILTISYDASPLSEVAKDVESEMKFGGDKLEKKGSLPGGNKFFVGTHADFSRVVTLVKGSAMTLKCSFAYQPKKPPPAGAIDACKTLIVP